MEIKQYATILVSLVVGVVIFSALMPALGSAEVVAGEDITRINEGTGRTFKEMEPGDVLKCVSIYDGTTRTDTWTLNDKPVLNEGIHDLTWDWLLISDVFHAQVFSSSNSSVGAIFRITTDGSGVTTYMGGASAEYPTRTYVFEMDEDKKIHYTYYENGAEITTVEYAPTWGYVISTLEDGAYMSAQVTTNSYYAEYGNKDVILAGNYTTGDLDTGYYYGKNGVLTVVNTNYTGKVNFSQTLSEGTTDIFDTLITVTVSDGVSSESFSPYRALVPYSVSGHSPTGAMYGIISIIPILIGASILIGAIVVFVRK